MRRRNRSHLNIEDSASSTSALPDRSRANKPIASVLGAIDDLIENNRRRIELLEQMAQAIYREWFVHFRYPGHEETSSSEVVDRSGRCRRTGSSGIRR